MVEPYSLADCLANADALAGEVVDSWGCAFSKDEGDAGMPADLKVLLDAACVYQSAQRDSGLQREQFNRIDAQQVAKENAMRELFCKAWVNYHVGRAETRQ